MSAYTDKVDVLARRAEKWTRARIKPDLPPEEGKTWGKRTDENAELFNRTYWKRMNEQRIKHGLPHIPVGRF